MTGRRAWVCPGGSSGRCGLGLLSLVYMPGDGVAAEGESDHDAVLSGCGVCGHPSRRDGTGQRANNYRPRSSRAEERRERTCGVTGQPPPTCSGATSTSTLPGSTGVIPELGSGGAFPLFLSAATTPETLHCVYWAEDLELDKARLDDTA